MSWRFNGGRGAITCDLCNYIIKEPAVREDSKNADGDDVAAEFDLCVDIAACKLRQIRRKADFDRFYPERQAAKAPRFFPENYGWYGQGTRPVKTTLLSENWRGEHRIYIGVDFGSIEHAVHTLIHKAGDFYCVVCEVIQEGTIGGLAALVQLGEFGEPV